MINIVAVTVLMTASHTFNLISNSGSVSFNEVEAFRKNVETFRTNFFIIFIFEAMAGHAILGQHNLTYVPSDAAGELEVKAREGCDL
jgi:glycyl-tRNA synthetase alpha subunit